MTFREAALYATVWRQQEARRTKPLALLIHLYLGAHHDRQHGPPVGLAEVMAALGFPPEPEPPAPPLPPEALEAKLEGLREVFPHGVGRS